MSRIDRRFDAVVIGSGAAGSIAVKELTERGMDVLLLEAGRDLSDEDFVPSPQSPPHPLGMDISARAKAIVAGQHRQALRFFFNETSNRFLVNDRKNPYSTPNGVPYLWIRGRVLGGRLNTYGRVLQRMSDVDFKAASYDGHGMDWPICYTDLEPWYDRVEEFLGVYGNADELTHPPDGHYIGGAGLTEVEQHFQARVQARWPERKVIAWRYAAPNLERLPRGIIAARETGRLTTRTDAVVNRITVDAQSGLADGAVFVDRRTKREHRVLADVVVICASTIETLRLMLNSACDRYPNGLGNSSGLLGHYFMDQTMSLAFCDAPQFSGVYEVDDGAPHDAFYAPAGGVLIPRYENMDPVPERGFARGSSFQGVGGRLPVPEGHPAAFGLGGFGEMLPEFANRVELHPRRTDAWGVPIAHIRCRPGENDTILVRRQLTALREMTEHAGYRVNFVASPLGLDSKHVWPEASPVKRAIFLRAIGRSLAMGAAIHECGGARMGSDPSSSVLNSANQSWDVPNLFIPDGASFVSSSTVGPALTLMALAARTCSFIAEAHTTGSLTKPADG
jgi:choline dehydrogenase-like flavoprotein